MNYQSDTFSKQECWVFQHKALMLSRWKVQVTFGFMQSFLASQMFLLPALPEAVSVSYLGLARMFGKRIHPKVPSHPALGSQPDPKYLPSAVLGAVGRLPAFLCPCRAGLDRDTTRASPSGSGSLRAGDRHVPLPFAALPPPLSRRDPSALDSPWPRRTVQRRLGGSGRAVMSRESPARTRRCRCPVPGARCRFRTCRVSTSKNAW